MSCLQTSSASYWPTLVGETKQYGEYKVTLDSEEQNDTALFVRKLSILEKNVSSFFAVN